MTSTPLRPWAALVMASMASGLLSSMAMTPLLTFSARMAARRPSTMRPLFSSISRWSQVRWVSHSAPFNMMVSQYCPSFTANFTWVGKAAPPMPQMPAALMAGTIWSTGQVSTSPSG